MKITTFINVLIITVIMASCTPLTTESPIPINAFTSTHPAFTPTPTDTPFPTPTSQPFPSETPVPNVKPVLLAYTLWVDGGGELENCLAGSNQPIFILYKDGELIIFRDGQYWHSILSQGEIDMLIDEISATGLPRSPEVKEDGLGTFITLSFQGIRYLPPSNSYSESSFKKTVDIISQYHPKFLERYAPEEIVLWISKIARLEPFEAFLPKPIPQTRTWEKGLIPVSRYGDGYERISGKDVPNIMAQFDKFPDYQIFAEEKYLYITAICANIPFQ